MNGQCLGFDTSNYTTSAAVFGDGTAENRGKLLTVPEGALGLRQSDALFQHVKRLHLMVEQLRADGAIGEIAAVGASTRPREVEGSYMPCFLVGEGKAALWPPCWGCPFIPAPTSKDMWPPRPGPRAGRTCWTGPTWPGTCPAAPPSFCGWSRRATRSGRR